MLCIVTNFLDFGEVRGARFFFFLVSRSLGRHAARTKTMAKLGDGTRCSSSAKTDNEDTRHLMASMQEMMGTLVHKVTEIEKKYDELSKAKDSPDSVCENAEKEMYTAPGRGEEDNLSSISVTSRREERVSTKSQKKDCTSESDYCVTLQGP